MSGDSDSGSTAWCTCICTRWCKRCGYSECGENGNDDSQPLSAPVCAQPTSSQTVKLDSTHAGPDVVILKGGRRICGAGAALGSQSISQDKAYWEVKIQSAGLWAIGVANRRCQLQRPALLGSDADPDSWVLRSAPLQIQPEPGNGPPADPLSVPSSGCVLIHRGETIASLGAGEQFSESDVIGVAYDHVDLAFYKNGHPVGTLHGMRGTMYPVVCVADGAILDVCFTPDQFASRPPPGFREILLEQRIL